MKSPRNIWLWVIPVLLMATGLALQRLAGYPLDNDERYSFRMAGGLSEEAFSLADVWAAVPEWYPDQAYGLPVVNSIWGQIFGWNEFSLRLVPLFAGILAIAWTYRVGRDWFSAPVGWIAAILTSVSVLFVTYLHVIRPYTLVALFALMATWGYWRMILSNRNPRMSRIGQLSLLLGCIGIVYSHYYSVLVLLVIGLWHLLFMPKDRLWWRPFFILVLAGLSFIPQLEGFLGGIQETHTRPAFTDQSKLIRAAEVLPRFVQVYSNDLLSLPTGRFGMVPNLLGLALSTLAISFGLWRVRQREWFGVNRYPLIITLTLLLMILLMNEILLVMIPTRMRYLIVIWPLVSILIARGIWRTRGKWRLIVGFFTGVYVIYSLWANVASDLRYRYYPLQIHHPLLDYMRVVEKYGWQQDLLLIEEQLYLATLPKVEAFPAHYENVQVFSNSLLPQTEIENALENELRIWLLAGKPGGAGHRGMISVLLDELSLCRRHIQQSNLVLELYTRSVVHCPSQEPTQMLFGEKIELAASSVGMEANETLVVDLLLQADDATDMTAYSVALHVLDVSSGEKVAQGDQGLWLGRYNPVRSEIDISALPAGEYEVRIGLYNWQTLAHLPGMDLALGQTADFLILSQFQLE